jgi:hypothetical protein
MNKHGVFAFVFCALLGLAVASPDDDSAPGPLGLPSVETLKLRVSLSDEQARKCGSVYDEYRGKARDIENKGDDQKKAMRGEIVSKLHELLSEGQGKKLDELLQEPQKERGVPGGRASFGLSSPF